MTALLRSLLLVTFVSTAACSRSPKGTPADAGPLPRMTEAPTQEKRVLAGVPWLIELREDGGSPIGFVSVPLGAVAARPIMVALHGGSDRPEWACGAWRGVTDAYPVLVCPRGQGSEHSLSWHSSEDTARRIERAIAATKKILPEWVRDSESIVLAGFSMGAVQAALLARKDPMRYRQLALGESAYNPESSIQFAAAWARGGGERLLLSCSLRSCEAPYEASARNAAKHGIAVRLNMARTNKHNIDDPVVRSIRRDWPWLVANAPGWEKYEPAEHEDAGVSGSTTIVDPRDR